MSLGQIHLNISFLKFNSVILPIVEIYLYNMIWIEMESLRFDDYKIYILEKDVEFCGKIVVR
jgi:hypothetical protein